MTTDPADWLAARMPLLATAAENSELVCRPKQLARLVPTSEFVLDRVRVLCSKKSS